jgi:hypothetical protein
MTNAIYSLSPGERVGVRDKPVLSGPFFDIAQLTRWIANRKRLDFAAAESLP